MGYASEGQEVALLTGREAGEMLRAAFGRSVILRDWSVHSLHHRPGAGVSVGYSVILDRVGEEGELTRCEEYMCASTAKLANSQLDSLVRMNYGDTKVSVWRYPEDPELPALPIACSPSHMSVLLGQPVTVELMSYRPTRRAVVRARDEEGRALYGKVMRPKQAKALAKRQRLISDSDVPSPRLILDDPRGLVLTSAANGVPLSHALSRGMGAGAGQMLFSLNSTLEALPSELMDLPARPAWAEKAAHYAHAAATALPEERKRCEDLAAGINRFLKVTDPGERVPVHGDFYEANIYVDPDAAQVTGIIDIDSLGPGHRVDDWACLLGHVSVLPSLAPQSYPHVESELAGWVTLLEEMVDPAALCTRTAGVVLSLVAGAKRVDGRPWKEDALSRLATAEHWLERARTHRSR